MFETLVISGGSTKGIMVLGALHYINCKYGLRSIQNYFGTSAGALISLLIAVGYKPIDLALYFRELNFNFDFLINKKDCQLIDYDNVMAQIEQIFLKKVGRPMTLKQIYTEYNKSLTFVTFNYTRGEMELLSHHTRPDMDCVEAVKLSCALPLIFKRCTWSNDLYIDGGIVNNFPLDIAVQSGAERILALKIDAHWKSSLNDSIITIINNAFFVPITDKMREVERAHADKATIINLISDVAPFNFRIPDDLMFQMIVEGFLACQIYLSLVK